MSVVKITLLIKSSDLFSASVFISEFVPVYLTSSADSDMIIFIVVLISESIDVFVAVTILFKENVKSLLLSSRIFLSFNNLF